MPTRNHLTNASHRRRLRGIVALLVSLAAGLALGWISPPSTSAQQIWSLTPPMPSAHRFAGAALLRSGQVLVAGGGSATDTHTTDAAIFDPATGLWQPTAPLPRAHRYHEQMRAVMTGEVLFVGDDSYGTDDALAHLYDAQTGAWTTTANQPLERRFQATLTAMRAGRELLYVGGYGGGASSPTFFTAEIYHVASRTWRPTDDLNTPRLGHTATLLSREPEAMVMVTGGMRRDDGTVHRSAERYDPRTGQWQPAASMFEPRVFHTATPLLSGEVLVTGGEHDGVNSATAEIYDPALNRWRAARPMHTPRSRHSATLLESGQVLVVGGSAVRGFDNPSASTEIYDPATDTWSDAGQLNNARTTHTATLLATGKVLVAGGVGAGGEVLNTAELFEPTAPTATPPSTSTAMPSATAPATSTPLPTATPPPAPHPVCIPRLCPRLDAHVPAPQIAAALADPAAVEGFCLARNPAMPPHPLYNPRRVWLELADYGKPFHPVFNGLVFRAGCR